MFQLPKTGEGPNLVARVLLLASVATIGFAAPGYAKPTYITFDVQGASSTTSAAINSSNVVTGTASGFDGFVRAADGTITTFDVTNANGTHPVGINDDGTITGWYFDSNYEQHGFVRSPDGTITTIDPKGSSGTVAVSLDARGFITGTYTCASIACGYVLSPKGKYTSFEVSGSPYTSPAAINASRQITGYYLDNSHNQHGFVRGADGTMTDFDVSGAADTDPVSLNAGNTITGTYTDSSGNPHGFLRTSDGKITDFDAPKATFGTFPGSINRKGTIAGSYDTQNEVFGFLRTPAGGFKKVLVEGSIGTTVSAVNDADVATGYYLDSSYNAHGYLRMPCQCKALNSGEARERPRVVRRSRVSLFTLERLSLLPLPAERLFCSFPAIRT